VDRWALVWRLVLAYTFLLSGAGQRIQSMIRLRPALSSWVSPSRAPSLLPLPHKHRTEICSSATARVRGPVYAYRVTNLAQFRDALALRLYVEIIKAALPNVSWFCHRTQSGLVHGEFKIPTLISQKTRN